MPRQKKEKNDLSQAVSQQAPDGDAEMLGRFSAIYERDVDLLLLEEFNCSPSFCAWFLLKLGLSHTNRTLIACAARHSVASASDDDVGESDLEIVFDFDTSEGRKSLLVLLEDKVMARFTPDQPARYQIRAQHLAERKGVREYLTVLVAPKGYLEGLDCFNRCVSYEDVKDYLTREAAAASTELHARYIHRAAILRHAIDGYRRGGNRANDKARTDFFDDYYLLAVKCDRNLKQKPSRQRSRRCLSFFYELMPRCGGVESLFLEHKLEQGIVGIEFRGWGEHQSWYMPRLQKVTEHDSDMFVESLTAHTLCVRIYDLPELDLDQPLCEQEDAARCGIEAAARLLSWYKGHVRDFNAWAAKARVE
jgi:hypothetical protein